MFAESPRWLVKKGRLEAASDALKILNDLPEDHEAVQDDIAKIQQSLDANAARSGTIRNLFRTGEERTFNRAIIAVLGMSVLMHLNCNLCSFTCT